MKHFKLTVFGLFICALFSCKKDIDHQPDNQADHLPGAQPTQVTDFRRYKLSVIPEKNSTIRSAAMYKSNLSAGRMSSILPSSVDLSNKFPAVGNQQNQSSCVGWATGYYLKSYQEGIEAKWLVKENAYSPSWIYNQINGGVDEGAYMSDALKLIQSKGCDQLKYFPYDANNYTRQPNATSKLRGSLYKASTWAFLPNNVSELKNLLASGKAFVFSIGVYDDFYDLNSKNPVYDTKTGFLYGFHALCMVGYDDSKQAFKFINSWSTRWGINGYGWISYKFVANYPLVGFRPYILEDAKNLGEAVVN